MKIQPGSLVLEVGSGNNPRHESSILCDRFIHTNHQRAGEFSIVINRPFVVADGYKLPFQDNAFDYVICSHVLEHLTHPEKFIKELTRVAKAGYIEVPNIFGERLFGWDFHLWYCQVKNKKLIFSQKKEGEQYDGFFHKLIVQSLGFRKFFEKNESTFYVRYEWKNSIPFAIKKISTREIAVVDKKLFSLLKTFQYTFFDLTSFWLMWMVKRVINKSKKVKRIITWSITRKLFKEKVILNLLSVMECVSCHSAKLVYTNNKISCRNCQTVYPLDRVIPVMLLPKERKKGY